MYRLAAACVRSLALRRPGGPTRHPPAAGTDKKPRANLALASACVYDMDCRGRANIAASPVRMNCVTAGEVP